MGVNIGSLVVCMKTPYHAKSMTQKHLSWGIFCGSFGLMLAPAGRFGGPLLFDAAMYTAGIVGGFSAVAACAPDRRFLTYGGPLSMGLGIVTVSSFGALLFAKSSFIGQTLDALTVYGGLALFSTYILYDTQRLIDRVEKYPVNHPTIPFDPINNQLELFLDALNIFIRIVEILKKLDDEKKKRKNKKT